MRWYRHHRRRHCHPRDCGVRDDRPEGHLHTKGYRGAGCWPRCVRPVHRYVRAGLWTADESSFCCFSSYQHPHRLMLCSSLSPSLFRARRLHRRTPSLLVSTPQGSFLTRPMRRGRRGRSTRMAVAPMTSRAPLTSTLLGQRGRVKARSAASWHVANL